MEDKMEGKEMRLQVRSVDPRFVLSVEMIHTSPLPQAARKLTILLLNVFY